MRRGDGRRDPGGVVNLLYDIAIGTVTGILAGLIVEWLLLRRQIRESALGKMLLGGGSSTPALPATKAAGWPATRWA